MRVTVCLLHSHGEVLLVKCSSFPLPQEPPPLTSGKRLFSYALVVSRSLLPARHPDLPRLPIGLDYDRSPSGRLVFPRQQPRHPCPDFDGQHQHRVCRILHTIPLRQGVANRRSGGQATYRSLLRVAPSFPLP